MPYTFKKSIKIGLWVVLPFLFTSYNAPKKSSNDPLPLEGEYKLRISGSPNLVLTGDIDFETVMERTRNGASYTALNLRLRSDLPGEVHSLGFLISREHGAKAISKGTYKISGKIDGFLKSFDGVFGFANIEAMGELPFFAKNGRIIISEIGRENVHGSIEVKLENPAGKLLNIKGNFTANKRITE